MSLFSTRVAFALFVVVHTRFFMCVFFPRSRCGWQSKEGAAAGAAGAAAASGVNVEEALFEGEDEDLDDLDDDEGT